MTLNARLINALGPTPAMPEASVSEVVGAAMEALDGTPRFDPRLLSLEWPDLSTPGAA
jgi:hypothetical protein